MPDPFAEFFADCSASAIHLEMRDAYTPNDPAFLRWRAGGHIDGRQEYDGWYDLVRATVARGVRMRRVRIASEPLSDFLRYEHAVTSGLNVAAGEVVRWLPRERAAGLLVPANDLWIIDDRLIRWGFFAGDGEITGDAITEDPAVVRPTVGAVEAIWSRAIDHGEYDPA